MSEETRTRVEVWVQALLVIFLLYVFLVGVKALESGIKAFGADFTDRLFQEVSHPIAGLFVGILATVLVQSSSVTTSTIVGLVGSGVLAVPLAVPMVMGANIGTTVTNTLASLGFLRRSQEFKRAFAGATMHDFFNLLAVAIFLPLELTTHFLSKSATALAGLLGASTTLQFDKADSPIKAAVKAPVVLIENGLESLGAHQAALGALLLIVGIFLIFVALAFITRTMRRLMAGRIERSMNAILSRGGGVPAIMVGIIMTVAVQSSSITTSLLVPMIAAGVLTLENGFPVTLGANVGTTATALLAALATDRPEGLIIALVHTLFNVGGLLVFYPVPAIRRVPLWMARKLAAVAEVRKSAVLIYVVGVFILLPLVGLLLFD